MRIAFVALFLVVCTTMAMAQTNSDDSKRNDSAAAAARQHQTRKGEHHQVCKWIPAMNSRPSIPRPPNGKAGDI
jgi:hypothetical protein